MPSWRSCFFPKDRRAKEGDINSPARPVQVNVLNSSRQTTSRQPNPGPQVSGRVNAGRPPQVPSSGVNPPSRGQRGEHGSSVNEIPRGRIDYDSAEELPTDQAGYRYLRNGSCPAQDGVHTADRASVLFFEPGVDPASRMQIHLTNHGKATVKREGGLDSFRGTTVQGHVGNNGPHAGVPLHTGVAQTPTHTFTINGHQFQSDSGGPPPEFVGDLLRQHLGAGGTFDQHFGPGGTFGQHFGPGGTFEQQFGPGSNFHRQFGPGGHLHQQFGPGGAFEQRFGR